MTLLCFLFQSLIAFKFIDEIVVDFSAFIYFDFRRRLQNANNLRDTCFELIDISVEINDKMLSIPDENIEIKRKNSIVRIAYSFVQEYLTFDYIKQFKVATFQLQNSFAHVEIAQICFMYLQKFELFSENRNYTQLNEFLCVKFVVLN